MGTGTGLAGPGEERVEAALRELVARAPDVAVAAVTGDASPVMIAVPESVPVPRSAVVAPSTQSSLLVASDAGTVASVWLRARSHGTAVGRVRLDKDPSRHGELHAFDLRQTHGAVILAYVPPAGAAAPGPGVRGVDALWGVVLTQDAQGTVSGVGPGVSELLGWLPEEITRRHASEFVHPDDVEIWRSAWAETLGRPGPGPRLRLRLRHRDDSWVWVEVLGENRLDDPAHRDVRSQLVDIGGDTAAIEALQGREKLFGQLAETVPVGLFAAGTDDRLLFVNGHLEQLTGVRAAATLSAQFSSVVAKHRDQLDAALADVLAGSEAAVEAAFDVPGDGGVRHCTVAMRPLLGTTGPVIGVTGCVSDITEMVSARRVLETMASSDALTGCANRTATLAALESMLRRHCDANARNGAGASGVAVLFLDLDELKGVNDRYGHATGDRFLVTVAQRIEAATRSGDVVGRYGGDEFVVVCGAVPDASLALHIGRSLAAELRQPVVLDTGALIPLGVSLGASWTDSADMSAHRLIQLADEAMYASKRAGDKEPVLASATPARPGGGRDR